MVPADFQVHSAWIESFGGNSLKITVHEDEEVEDAEWFSPESWAPFLRRTAAVLSGVTVVVIICLLALAVATAVHTAILHNLVESCGLQIPTLPKPTITPP